ncbi:MAG: YaiI/YqxD family protein [Alphaproteobacteria bacterium]|nr:YaiI/YqxD family protein [Alphaproteobacteria bacterium]
MRIFVDADACPVKEEVFKVALRTSTPVTLVANSYLRIPRHELFDLVVVEMDPDAADDHIAERAGENSIVITADIPLADRCIKAGAAVIAPNGKLFTESSIGSAMATRALMQDLRAGGDIIGGPPPFERRDRSQFLQALDRAIVQRARG